MLAQRRGEIVLDDHGVGAARLQRRRRLGAAERADERLLRRIPVGFGAAGGAAEFLPRGRDRSVDPALAGGSVTTVALLEEIGDRAPS